MIPILYESNETAFVTNGLGRLRDALNVKCSEERNGIYEVDFDYPIDGAHFDDILCGRIIAVTHDDTGDVQPFDIVSYSKPISGVVSFHAVHISYRQNEITVQQNPKGINSLTDAFARLRTAVPSNPFTYESDITSSAYMASADGIPRTVRQMLGGVEGSILDAYGGEFEWDKFRVILHKQRGEKKDFAIRYGLNMADYKDDTDYSDATTSYIPYWANGDNIRVGYKAQIGLPRYNGRDVCRPLDLTDKFETKPTSAQLRDMAKQILATKNPNLPKQNITVDFIRLQDFGEYEQFRSLLQCKLCDQIDVVFPKYGMRGTYKIVKTVWDVLQERYEEMELGSLSTSLSEALGITGNDLATGGGAGAEDYIVDNGTATGTCSGISTANVTWNYRKWASGRVELWTTASANTNITQQDGGGYRTGTIEVSIPSGLLPGAPMVFCNIRNAFTNSAILATIGLTSPSATSTGQWAGYRISSVNTNAYKYFNFYVIYNP